MDKVNPNAFLVVTLGASLGYLITESVYGIVCGFFCSGLLILLAEIVSAWRKS